MQHFIYKTTNLLNGKIYIGQHSTNKLEDGYLGTGKLIKRAIKKYGKQNFKREILEFCTPESSNERETFFIQKFSATTQNIGYNIAIHGAAPMKGRKHSREVVDKFVKNRSGEKHWLYGKGHLISGNKNPFYGKGYINEGVNNPRAVFHYTLRDPQGNIQETECLSDLCKQHNLNHGTLLRVLDKTRRHHKGWVLLSKTLRNQDHKKTSQIISTDQSES